MSFLSCYRAQSQLNRNRRNVSELGKIRPNTTRDRHPSVNRSVGFSKTALPASSKCAQLQVLPDSTSFCFLHVCVCNEKCLVTSCIQCCTFHWWRWWRLEAKTVKVDAPSLSQESFWFLSGPGWHASRLWSALSAHQWMLLDRMRAAESRIYLAETQTPKRLPLSLVKEK